jgi:hypothetical protein
MRRVLCFVFLAVNFDLNVHVGDRPAMGVPVPGYGAPPVVIEHPPLFLFPPALGFYVAAGVPYDLFMVSDNYYLHRGGVWYEAPHYSGPWVAVPYRHVPFVLRRYGIPVIHQYRDREYRVYESERGHYHGGHFRPDKEWKEHRKAEHEMWKEHRKAEHERWKEEKRWYKEERKHDKHHGWDDD